MKTTKITLLGAALTLLPLSLWAQNSQEPTAHDNFLDGNTPLIQMAHYGGHHKKTYRQPKRADWNAKTEFYGEDRIADGDFAELAYRPSGQKHFIFDPRQLKWYAYNQNGNLVASGRASGGRGYCPDIGRSCRTPVGSFSVHHKGSAYCKSSKYPVGRGGAPMPYCMFFRGGYAIHGSPDVPSHNASHGCIRVLPSAARWLHGNFIDYGTKVIVKPY